MREDLQLPLARLRARDQMIELRNTDLRFTPAEAAAFLRGVMSLNLSAEDMMHWKSAPKAGLPACNWPRFHCRDSTTPPASSNPSLEAAASLSITLLKKYLSASLKRFERSCCEPPFLSAYAPRYVMRCST